MKVNNFCDKKHALQSLKQILIKKTVTFLQNNHKKGNFNHSLIGCGKHGKKVLANKKVVAFRKVGLYLD